MHPTMKLNIPTDISSVTENIVWNTKSHQVHGFTGDFGNVNDDIRSILCGDDEKPVAREVNQWKFRSITNKTIDCEFFFNGGALSNSDIR